MKLRRSLFRKERSIIISGEIGFKYALEPAEVLNGTAKSDKVSKKLDNLLIGVDISSLQKFRAKDKKGNFYYNMSGWNLVEIVREQRKNNPLLQQEEYQERLRYGLGPYNIFIPENCCSIMDLS